MITQVTVNFWAHVTLLGHIDSNRPFRIVPINVHAAKERPIPIHGDGVVFFESSLEMLNVFPCCGFDTKVIDDEAKSDVTPHMASEAGSVLALVIALGVETLFEELVGCSGCWVVCTAKWCVGTG